MIEPPIDERYELAAVKESLTTDERTTAEETYTRRAFDYEQNPVGSRDWTLFWSGWCARATQPVKAQPPCGTDGVWRPIETAPLDGRAVLVMRDNWPGTKSGRAETCQGHNTYVAEWWAESNEWMCYMSLPCEPVCPIAPTHWMPLPDVPSSQPAAPVAPATVAVPVPDGVVVAFGLLWHVRMGCDFPVPQGFSKNISPEEAAAKARRFLSDLLTQEQKGDGINRASELLAASQREGGG